MSTSNTTPFTGADSYPAFWSSHVDIRKMAAQQGVMPVESIDQLRGDFWPDWEPVDEFDETIRQWRHEED